MTTDEKQAVALARRFLEAMAQANPEALLAMMSDHPVIAAPYAPVEIPLPRRNEGRENCLLMLEAMMGGIENFEWPELDLHSTDSPGLVMGTGSSRIQMRNGVNYENHYCFKFIIRDGKVAEYHEYFDPAPTLKAFGGY